MSVSFIKVLGSLSGSAVEVLTHLVGGKEIPVYKMQHGDETESKNITGETPLPVSLLSEKSAFGELLTVEPTPLVNVEFSYSLHPELVTTRLNHGTASVDSNRLRLSTGAAANQSAQLFTKKPIKYYAGIGARGRFTGIFTSGIAGSVQAIGVGDNGDGFFFGFNGADFGILHRRGGNPEIRTIQVTTKSTTSENITITLDGDADSTVTVSDASATDATTTANEIATHDFSNLGRGWIAIANGDEVNFISFNSQSRAGAYSLSGATTAIGSDSQKLAGVAQTDAWYAQTAWNQDRFLQSTDPDNSPSGVTLDQTKGNVFQVKYQWLGFGRIYFYIEHPDDGKLELAHTIDYANANTVPSINNPTLPLCAIAENTTNTTDIVLYSSSLAGFAEGRVPEPIISHVHIRDKTLTTTTIVPVVTIHNNGVFQSKLNRVTMRVKSISVQVESGKPALIQVIRGAIITGAVFADHNTGESVALIDTTATAVTNGEIIDAFSVATADEKERAMKLDIEPTEFLTIAAAQSSAGTNTVLKLIVTWEENF